MIKRSARATLFACLLGTASVFVLTIPAATPAMARAASGPSVSAPVGKLLGPAQKLLEAKDYNGALTLIKQAQALPDQTPYDTYAINNFLASASLALNDYTTADVAYEAMADSAAMPDNEKSATLHNATLLANQAKHYDKAIKYGQAYIALGGPSDPAIIAAMSQSYYFINDFANAEAYAQKSIDATPAGQPPNRAALEIKLSAQLKAKHEDAASATLETIATYYNDLDDWGQIIDFALGAKGMKDFEALHIYRLRLAAKATGLADDYTTPASLALALSYPVEAESFLNAGIAAGKVARNDKQVGEVAARAASDRKVIDQFDALARKTATGDLDLKLAETYYGYGRYDDAIAAARRALTKGGAKMNANEAQMVIGESLLAGGKTADAVAAFNAVQNPTPAMAKAQHIWLVFANRKYDASTPAQ